MLLFELQISNQRWERADEINMADLLQDEDLSDENSSEDGPLEKAAESGASQFCCSKMAEIARERKVQLNPPTRPWQKRSSRGCKDPPVSVHGTELRRMKENTFVW